MPSAHNCDRKGPPAKVIDEAGDEPITGISEVLDVRAAAGVSAAPLTRLGPRRSLIG
jgi:hypothetical protein